MLFKKKPAPPANGGALVPKAVANNSVVQALMANSMLSDIRVSMFDDIRTGMMGVMYTEEVLDIPIDLNGLWKDEEHGAIVSLFDSPRKRSIKFSGGMYQYDKMSEILKAGFILSVPNEGFCRAKKEFVLSSIMPKREFRVLVICQHFTSEETGTLELSVLRSMY